MKEVEANQLELETRIKSMCETYGLSQVRQSIHAFAQKGELTTDYILILRELRRVEDLDKSTEG